VARIEMSRAPIPRCPFAQGPTCPCPAPNCLVCQNALRRVYRTGPARGCMPGDQLPSSRLLSGTSAAAITIPPSREGQTLGLYRGRFCYRHLGAILADTLAEMGIIDGRNDVRKPRLRARQVSECPKTGLRESRKRSMREIKCDHLSLRKAFLTRILTGVMNVRSTLNSIRRHSLSNRPNGTRL